MSKDRDEIEITPEMVAAGAAELAGFVVRDIVDGFASPADVAVAVYRAMMDISRRRGVDRRVPEEGSASVGRSSSLTPDREKEVVARWIDRRRALGDIIWK
jgi:hypothetical protein